MEVVGKMWMDVKLFDFKYSVIIVKFVESVLDEVVDIVDRKYLEFF